MLRSILPLTTIMFALAFTACSAEGSLPETTSTTVPTSTSSTAPVTSTTLSVSTTVTTDPGPTTTTEPPRRLGDELVFNADFDVGDVTPAGWELIIEDGIGQTVEYVQGSEEHHLSFFAQVVADAPWPEARQVREFEVTPHTDYLVSVEARSDRQGRLFYGIGFRDADGDDILIRGPGEPEFTGTDWTTVEGEIESPHDAATGYVILRLALRADVVPTDAMFLDVNRVSVKEILD